MAWLRPSSKKCALLCSLDFDCLLLAEQCICVIHLAGNMARQSITKPEGLAQPVEAPFNPVQRVDGIAEAIDLLKAVTDKNLSADC